MKTVLKFSIVFAFIAFSMSMSPPKDKSTCKILHEGTFTYGEGKDLVKVVIKGSKHTEYHNDGKYYIKSTIKWVDDCEYNMTMKKVNIPNFPYGKGDVLNGKIIKVEGKVIYLTATVKNQSWPSVLTKVE